MLHLLLVNERRNINAEVCCTKILNQLLHGVKYNPLGGTVTPCRQTKRKRRERKRADEF